MAMVRKIWRMPLPALLLTLLVGCVNFSYQGEEFAPTENVSVFYSASEVPADFAVIGKARASGNYSEVTNDQLVDKLIEEAKSKGADGVLITQTQVKPEEEDSALTQEDAREVFPNNSAENTGWNTLLADFGGGYGSVNDSDSGWSKTYIRIIRADFLRKQPAAKP